MTITKTWQINTMERDLSDGYVTKVIYRIKATDTSDGIEKARETGEITFTKPSSLPSEFIDYNNLNESTVVNWIKTKLGSTDVASIEAKLNTEVELVKNPVTATGKPWS
tara:strand:- start:439 stop:765 length:327 start_codon:yes stop_codon:yes gene_type:complete